ncbi:MAG: hypothetical protein Q8O67_16590 [Deltaproteobacteria bacterium]|nr:hypothetical protein [Deltaproteobacteria bacterium]
MDAVFRSRPDLSITGLVFAGVVVALFCVDVAHAAPRRAPGGLRLAVDESKELEVTLTVEADKAPTFQVYKGAAGGDGVVYVVELPGVAVGSTALSTSGPGVLLHDARVEGGRKGSADRVVLTFADDVDFDAAADKGTLAVRFHHAGDKQALLAQHQVRLVRLAALTQKADETRRHEADELARTQKETDDKRATEQRLLAEQKRLADEKRVADEKRAAEEKKAAELKRVADEKRIAEEKQAAELKRVADEKRLAEAKRAAEQKRIADEKLAIELAKKQAAELEDAKRKAAELAKKQAEEARVAAEIETKKKALEAQKAAEAEAKKRADDAVKAELQRLADEAARKKAEALRAEQLRIEQQRAEQLRIEQQRAEQLRMEQQRAELQRIELQREQQRAEQERAEGARRARAAEQERAQQAERQRQIDDDKRRAQALADEQHRLQEQRLAQRREEERLASIRPAKAEDTDFGGVRKIEPAARAPAVGAPAAGHAALGTRSIELSRPSRYERYQPPREDDDGFGGDDDDDALDESGGRSVLSHVTVQRTGDGARVGVHVDGGARYQVSRRGKDKILLTLFDTRVEGLDVRRTLDARSLGTSVLRVMPTVEEDSRFRVQLVVETRGQAPVKIDQDGQVLWLGIAE